MPHSFRYILLLPFLAPPLHAGDIDVFPAKIVLTGKDSRQQVLLTAKVADVTRQVTYAVADPKIASVSATGLVKPLVSGQTHLEAVLGDERVRIPIEIHSGDQYLPLDFTADIAPILTKNGCNGGGCHGKSGGRGNFQLSLFGFNPEMDFDAIVKGSRGRRLLPSTPEHSLLIQKPAGVVPHGGGVRLPQTGDEYERLARWIATGASWGTGKAPTLKAIEVAPNSRILRQKSTQQVVVMALYSDGSRRDVTPQVEFQSNDPAIATVDEHGLATANDRIGETAIVCKYQGQVGVSRIVVPNQKPDLAAQWPKLPKGNFIDDLVMSKLRELNVPPSPLVDDAGFLRRASLQITGRLPTIEEAKSFLDDKDEQKREKLVDRLLETGAHADLFAQKWASVLRNKLRSQKTRVPGTIAFHRWIRNAIADNMPYDQFVREIITATGSPTHNPPSQWYAEVRFLDRYVDDTAQVFLGLRIGCARCHNHPSERYTQEDYFGLAAFFGRVDRKGGAGLKTERAADETIFVKATGTVKLLGTEKVILPHGLDGPLLDIPPQDDPRAYLVDWMTQSNNPYFARAFVNRMWAHFFGRGLVEPLDDLRATNPASNEPLLNALAADFIKHKFDSRRLLRLIATSTTFQLSSTATEDNLGELQAHSRYYPQRMGAEVLYDAINTATKSRTPKFADMPEGTRAVQLPHEEYNDPLLDLFGRPKRESACECERIAEPSMGQSIYMMNNPTFQNKVRQMNLLAKDKRTAEEKVNELFLAVLTRYPRAEEMAAALEFIRADDSPTVYADLMWALLNTKEFLYIL